jgi:DNA polymerase-3 subunit delta
MELDYAKIAAKGFPKPISTVYLFSGSDDALKREALQQLIQPLLDDSMADFDREERDAPAGGVSSDPQFARQVLASAAGMPMLSERRVVVVTNVQRLGKEDQEALAAGLGALGNRSLLVLVAGAPEYEAGKVKGRTALGAKLTNTVAKAGTVVLCDAPTEGDLSARARSLAASAGKQIDPEALRRLVGRAKAVAAERGGGGKGGDLHVLTHELEKVIAYVGTRLVITRADAAAVGLSNAEENIFALLDAVGKRDVKRALGEVEEMLRVGDKPDGVAARTFVMLARHFRLLWGAKFLAENRLSGERLRGGLPPDVQSVLSGELIGLTQRQSYLLRSLQEQSRGWSDIGLRRALARTLASDLAMKGIAPIPQFGSAPGEGPAVNLRLLVVDLCGYGEKA